MSDRTLAGMLGRLPESIEALAEEHKQDLADALRTARRRQSAALAKGGNAALQFIPAMVRPAVRKAVGL
jgi:hypothetical protein